MSDKDRSDPLRVYKEFDENDPAFLIRILSLRVDALTKEKEDMEEKERNLERRIAKLEASYGKGAGILIGLGFVGTIGGVLMAYGRSILAPWTGK
jgi:hypothetical protein